MIKNINDYKYLVYKAEVEKVVSVNNRSYIDPNTRARYYVVKTDKGHGDAIFDNDFGVTLFKTEKEAAKVSKELQDFYAQR